MRTVHRVSYGDVLALALGLYAACLSSSAAAQPCEKVRACNAMRPCELQVDTRSCSPTWGCDYQWYQFFAKAGCEVDKLRFKTQCEIAKATQNKGYEVAKAACEAQKAAEKFDCERIKASDRFICEAGHALEHFGQEFEKEFCNLMTLGAYKRGEASCGINAGVAYDKDGFYTYNPSAPDVKYRGNEGKSVASLPTAAELDRLAIILNGYPPFYFEKDFDRAFGLSRFIPGTYKLGTPWPDSAGSIYAPTKSGLIRDQDKLGGGGFLSLRAEKNTGQVRFHVGIDYVAMPKERIFAPVSGELVRMKNPGTKGLTGLLITTPEGYTASVYYVAVAKEYQPLLAIPLEKRTPEQRAALTVVGGKTTVGYAQDLNLHHRYKGITNHVHVTLQDPNGAFVSPQHPKDVRVSPKPKRPTSSGTAPRK